MDSIPPQPTVMVTGGPGEPLRTVARRLFAARSRAADGVVVVTTRDPPGGLVDRLTDGSGAVDADHVAVVDCRDGEAERAENGGAVETDAVDPGWVRRVSRDVGAEGLDETITSALSWLDDAGVERRHFLYDVLGTDRDAADPEGAYDRAYELAMTVGAEEGLALFALQEAGIPDDVVEKLGHLFDVHVDLRAARERPELRWTGLMGASDGWVDLAEVDLGAGGFR